MDIARSLWRAFAPMVPTSVVSLLENAWIASASVVERLRPPETALPPASLRYRVHGSPWPGSFRGTGRQVADDLERALSRSGRRWSSLGDVLDFGCGCGRVLAWLRGSAATCRLHGTDIDAEAVRWCEAHLPFADFRRNDPMPPGPYAEGSFDCIYAVSVFTHLDREHQRAWRAELRRIARPGAVLLVSLNGEPAAIRHGVAGEDLARLRRDGFLLRHNRRMRRFFPGFYQDAYQTPEFVAATWGRDFRIVELAPGGLAGLQDLLVLEA